MVKQFLAQFCEMTIEGIKIIHLSLFVNLCHNLYQLQKQKKLFQTLSFIFNFLILIQGYCFDSNNSRYS